MPSRVILAFLLGFGLASPTRAGNPGNATARPGAIAIAPARTSIYIGLVTLTLPPLQGVENVYSSSYSAKVFPYFFYNESGSFVLEVTDEDFRRLAAGTPVNFHGRAVSSEAEERKVEGTATPMDSCSGKIKVRIFVTQRIQLIFNTTYQLIPAGGLSRPGNT